MSVGAMLLQLPSRLGSASRLPLFLEFFRSIQIASDCLYGLFHERGSVLPHFCGEPTPRLIELPHFREDLMKGARWMVSVTLLLSSGLMAAQSFMNPRDAVQTVSFKVHVPFSFMVGNQILPPGSYRIQRLLGPPGAGDQVGMIVVRGTDHYAYKAILTKLSPESNDSRTTSRLLFSEHEGQRYLSEVRIGGEQGHVVPYSPGELESQSDVSGEQVAVAELH